MKVVMPRYIHLECTDVRRELQALVEEAHCALNHYIGDNPLDLPDAAQDLYGALRELVSWAEHLLDADAEEEP